MTKQEEIREGTAKKMAASSPLYDDEDYDEGWDSKGEDYKEAWRESAGELLSYLHSQGVVMKVVKNTADFIKCPCDDCTAEHKLIDEWGYFCDLTCGLRSHWISRCRGRQETLEAGYIAIEPLIVV